MASAVAPQVAPPTPGAPPVQPSSPAFAPGCSGRLLMMGACPSERGLAGTTPDQVKQSLIGAAWVWGDALGGPLLEGAGGLLTRFLVSRMAGAAASPAALVSGRAFEAQKLQELGLAKNVGAAWRPSTEQMNSAAFRVIVGEPKFTGAGLPQGVIPDSVGLEIKSDRVFSGRATNFAL